MNEKEWSRKAAGYLETLCGVKPNRRTGSTGNREATAFFARTIQPWGWGIDMTPFTCLDHRSGEAFLMCGDRSFDVQISPFSPGCEVTAGLKTVSTIEELADCDCRGKILLMKGPLCAEPLMPKNFIFYNPDHHKKIYALLEEKRPAAIVTATGEAPDLVGALYPFPLIEDGDFDIPSVYCTDSAGEEIVKNAGETCSLKIEAERILSTACNVIARKNPDSDRKILICAHIDAKETTPGASDNASGTVVELLLAEMLAGYGGRLGIEMAALNGEDYYSVGGQMDYLRRYGEEIEKLVVAINIDDVGYVEGRMAYSLYGCPDEIVSNAEEVFDAYEGIMKGEPWYQGDHMIFVQKSTPAIAFTAERVAELMATVTHTPKDVPEIIDCEKLVKLALALQSFILQLGESAKRP